MIRKAIIVVLTFCALAIGVMWIGNLSAVTWWQQPNKPTTARLDCAIRARKARCSYGVFWEERPSGVDELVQGVEVLGFSYNKFSSWTGPQFSIPAIPKCYDGYVVYAPLWFLFAMFATCPTIAFIRGPLRRWRRKRKSLCVKCGYDLTGNESGVCPECGTAVARCPERA